MRIYDLARGRQLVAAIELVSPANKDRPESRSAFVGKCAALLQRGVAVSIVDLVTVRQFNLYAELLSEIGLAKLSRPEALPPTYAVSLRSSKREGDIGALARKSLFWWGVSMDEWVGSRWV